MRISFFEDSSNNKGLERLRLLNFNTKLYLITSSYTEFHGTAKKFKNKFIKEIFYWPTLKIKECYWISPFNSKRIINVFEKNLNSNLLDSIELNKYKLAYLKETYRLFKSLNSFKRFIDNKKDFSLGRSAEGAIKQSLLNFFGLNFNPLRYKKSLIDRLLDSLNKKQSLIKREAQFLDKKHKDKYLLFIKDRKTLDKDLKIAKNLKAEEVIVYKLGSLKKEYLKIFKKYLH